MAKHNDPIEAVFDNPNWQQFRNYWKLIVGALVILVVIIGVYSTYYIVQPEEEAVVKRFGKVIAIKGPGPHFKLPFGIDTATRVPTARLLKEEFGFRSVGAGDRTRYEKDARHRDESLMLTGDLKVIDVEWVVHYLISDPNTYLHAVRNPTKSIRDLSEAVMRRIVGNSLGSDVLTEKRVEVSTKARDELQDALDNFDMGVSISRIELQDVTPPEMVKPAFNEVNQAEQERERLINEAEKRSNQVIPRAEGQARQIVSEAQGYAAERVNRSRGEAERFQAILAEYQNAPDVTRQRMFLEMLDELLPNVDRVYVIDQGAANPLPLFQLNPTAGSGIVPPQTQAPQPTPPAPGRE